MIACIPETRNLAPTGDTAEIKTNGNKIYTGELLLINEDEILLQINSGSINLTAGIYTIPIDNIQYIKIEDYINYKWQGAIFGFEVVPILLLIIAAASADAEPAGLGLLLVPVLLNYVIFAASTPAPPGVENPFQSEQLIELRKYARFPQGLTEDQLKSFLSIHNQDQLKTAN